MLNVRISGSFKELNQLFELEKLCGILHIDPYKLCMVDCESEEFVITTQMLVDAGICTK